MQQQRKHALPRFSLVMGIESCCEVDDLSCLGMLEKCRRAICKSGQFEFDSAINWKPVQVK